MSKRRYFKRLDDRTGRLERAVNIINDGEKPNLRVHKREADKPHPLSTPRAIPADRAQIVGPSDLDSDVRGFVYTVGFTADAVTFRRPSLAVVSLTTPRVLIDSNGAEEVV